MKKLVSMLLALVLMASLVACGGGSASDGDSQQTNPTASGAGENAESPAASDGNIQVALLISATGELNDNAFHESAWNGITKYCDANNLNYTYFQPSENTVEMQMALCDAAVEAGAEFIVVCSDQFKVALLEMSTTYPDVSFLSFEATPQNTDGEITVHDNVKVVTFAAEQSGYLAGYASVVDGYRELGVMGGKMVPGVIQYCYGFVAGADTAAKELDLDDVTVKYTYWGENLATPEYQAMAASWYQTGTEVIFVVAGSGNSSAFAAAEQNNGLAIGCDSDQSSSSDTVISSALKNLSAVCENTLADWAAGAFEGGSSFHLGAESDAVGLAFESSKFNDFTLDDYNTLYERLASNEGGIADAIPNDRTYDSPDEIPIEKINFEYIQ